jgi:single-stranded-DNA-specific exonuclease
MPDDPFAAGTDASVVIPGLSRNPGDPSGANAAARGAANSDRRTSASPSDAAGTNAADLLEEEPTPLLWQLDPAEHRETIRRAILGDRDYHLKQKEALAALESGRNTLLVMGTGRGKTAVFQTVAAELAAQGKISILIYPLRSLVNDQYQRMRRQFESLGIAVHAVNGSMDAPERNRFFQLYGQGKVNIVLTTPEFICFHRDRFTAAGERIGLLVTDEAHHIRQGDRKGYQQLPEVWQALGRPLVLAATATADDETAGRINQAFQIRQWVLEDHVRENLRLTDVRKEKDKLAYLMKIAGRREKTVVYVNSRRQSMELAQTLRCYLPFMEREIGFYHGGLDSESRRGLENRFRDTELRLMVSTSAFGEGVDIPDIRHVVLYHMCFSRAEFNQLSGRAGRNQDEAWIHLLFNGEDMALNRMILSQKAPDREILARFYLMLKTLQKSRRFIEAADAELAGKMTASEKAGKVGEPVLEETVSACLAILEEMKLLRLEYAGNRRYIHISPPPPAKLDLSDSIRFAEGQGEREAFEEFAAYIMNGSPDIILSGFNRPILPKSVKDSLQS